MRHPRLTLLPLFLALIICGGVLVAMPALAQGVDMEAFAQAAGFSTTASVTVIIARLIRTAIALTGVVTVVFIIYGGFMWMTSGGNAERLKKAKGIIINAIIGLLLVFASFAIVQFVLNAITSATGADISGEGPGYSSYLDSSSSSALYLTSVNTQCAAALKNLQLQFVFSRNVLATSVESGIAVRDDSGDLVDGSFGVSGRVVTFTPAAACPSPYEDEFCFDESSDYTVELLPAALRSTTGTSLSCTTYPCAFSFTTGTAVDVDDPLVSMDAPDDGESLYAGAIELLQAQTSDDSGVSVVDFYVIDDDEAIYSAGTAFSNADALLGGGELNPFFTDTLEEWDTAGYLTNEAYDVWARGWDCAGHSDTAAKVTIMLRAASCNNEEQDTDLGETGVNCGGPSSSAYYCGACEGDACVESSDCASGQCIEGLCVVTPKIESVSPGDGAVGNLVTISGEGFGAVPGTITFLGDELSPVATSAAVCNATTQWTSKQIIVEAPAAALDGPIQVTTNEANPKTDRTDNDYGPSISDFDVNAISRPGICALDPATDTAGSVIDVYGNSFGGARGSSTFYFTNYETSSYLSWGNDLLEVAVPNVNAGRYRTQVFTGDYVCVTPDGESTFATCSADTDCNTTAGESCATSWCSETLEYCETAVDCGTGGGSCGSIRVGSNQVSFTVTDVSSSSRPIISSIDTGWKACADDGSRCAFDSDCNPDVSCEDVGNWGPPGQYVTIYGTGFGTATGSVRFANGVLGYEALGDMTFPDACGDDFWRDTSVTVKVPESYLTDVPTPLAAITHALRLVRADGIDSESTDFVVLDDEPGPALCDIEPSAGPAGTETTLYGENFGATAGSVTFYSLQDASFGLWENDQISSAIVPATAVTGPVRVAEATGYTSNSLNFAVGDCREDAALCAEGESCCANGACSISCETIVPVASHYAFKISTGITPNTPRVLVACTALGVSPSPWEGWSAPEDVCVNASVEAEFNMAMNQSTINASTVVVRKCASFFTLEEEEDEDAACSFSGVACDEDTDCTLNDERCVLASEGECKTWTAVEPMTALQPVTDATGFSWLPKTGLFETSTFYRVSLQGVDKIASAAGGFMEEDYEWEFTTSDAGTPCQVGDVNVRPVAYTTTTQGDVNYSAQLIAANDRCVALSCVGYTVGWESGFDGAVIDVEEPGVGICTNVVDAQDETLANFPALITATVTNAANTPSDRGELTINFVDPEIDDYFPQCSTACINALPWGQFNTVMDASTIGSSSVTLYECTNSLCAPELAAADFVNSISYSPTSQKFFIEFATDQTMDPNTWYRVVVNGTAVLSQTGVPLSAAGSNYGTDDNRYFQNAFSWRFKTKNDAVSCAIDSVALDPDAVTLRYVGQRAEFDAIASGAPDDCSVQGQTLQSGSYVWDAWGATDDPNAVGASTGSAAAQSEITAYMISAGAIELTTEIPSYCTAACLNAGAPVTTADGVCGNGAVEASEECDDGGVDNGDGCSSSCLNEGAICSSATDIGNVCAFDADCASERCTGGVCQDYADAGDACTSVTACDGGCAFVQCPLTCEESGVACVSDASCAETCVGAVCGAAADVNEVCTLDSTCDSGSCSEAGRCDDFEDADASCTSNTQCDSISCVGECSISGEACAGQSSDCTYAVGDTCEISGAGCCGDGVRQWTILGGGEECDDGNLETGDGCSAVCRNEGSRSVDAVCGDGVRDWVVSVGGEDCDDGNTIAGDGCSRNCLLEGSASEEDVYAVCGNGIVEVGEDCDPGSYSAAGDGCSSSCLKEGTPACPTITSLNCCGNGNIDTGEECDGTEFCTNRCLRAGSSFSYSIPSFCGDGNAEGIGEECDAAPNASYAVGDYGVAQIAQGAPLEVDEDSGYAVSTVTATVDGDVTGDATLQLQCSCTTDLSCGEATLGCGASNCCYARPTLGDIYPADNMSSATTSVAILASATSSLATTILPGAGYCRNTAVWVEFSTIMDEASFDATQDTDGDGVIDQDEFAANLFLDLVSVANAAGNQVEVTAIGACPTGYQGAAPPPPPSDASSASRIWNWLKQLVLGIFGREANASETYACHVSVSYQTSVDADGSSRAYLRPSQLLEPNSIYRLVVAGDQNRADAVHDGVLSQGGVPLCLGANCTAAPFVRTFAVGEEICDLDRVLLEDTGNIAAAEYESPSPGFFRATGENHAFISTPQTYRAGFGYEEITPLPGLYNWAWGWTSSIAETHATNVVAAVAETLQDTTRNFTASGNDGREHVISTATIVADTLFNPTTAAVADDLSTLANEARSARTVAGTLEVSALLCENPWPALDSSLGFPYLEDDLPSNFSFYYCRDQGADGTADDLPALGNPIDVTSLASADILQELIFKVSGSSDAIGVRVIANDGTIGSVPIADSGYLSPSAWVQAQGFTGSFAPAELDGYPAVQAGNTLYAASANLAGATIYPNIYVVSSNDGASAASQEIFKRVLEHWRFNGNVDEVTDINLCQNAVTDAYATTTAGDYVSCRWDGDCLAAFDDPGIVCDGQKAKLTRDMQRLLDMTSMVSTLNTFGEENGHCAITKGQACTRNAQCPGTELCVAGFPEVQSGTFVPALSTSKWSSWSAAFGNELGTALPQDPLNEFYDCSTDGYDAASCWNGEAGSFICPDNSHLYGYQSVGGEAYLLYAQLELDGDYFWQGDIDASSTDEATVVVEYPVGNAPATGMPLGDGFASVPVFCDGGTWGASTLCGDGTQGLGEVCEIGDTRAGAVPCSVCVNPVDDALDGLEGCTIGSDPICGAAGECVAGTNLHACAIDAATNQCFWDETATAACIPYACGNGTLDPGEACDDGSLNGTYGHCSDSCTFSDALYCGDGFLAASEQCDCGTTSTYAAVTSVSTSWATRGPGPVVFGTPSDPWCDVSNGQYDDLANNCAYNCTLPGPSCGDGRVNGSEECDGGYEETIGKLCSDNFTECSTDADCPGAYTCSVAAAGTGDLCADFVDAGEACTSGSQCDSGECVVGACTSASDAGDVCLVNPDCDSGSCPDFNYDLYRYRSCASDSCTWPTWSLPVGGDQQCGNGGTPEGNEQCDDGNGSNNDACLNTCEWNVCGDDYVNIGTESCDDGDDNGEPCEAPYGGICNFCNATCQYQTSSGGYCGDGDVNGNEVCDGAYSTRLRFYDSFTRDTLGTCLYTPPATPPTAPATVIGDPNGYTCRWLGVCNGGSENGDLCTLDYAAYLASDVIQDLGSGSNRNSCAGTSAIGDEGECVPPVCADNCGSSCPSSFATTGLFVQSVGSVSPTESVNLYSYGNTDQNSPDSGTLFVPACTVATSLTADIDRQNVVLPDVDIVLVTDVSTSMNYSVSGGPSRMQIAVDASQNAVDALFDAYTGVSSGTIRIGLVSFQESFAYIDRPLTDETGESDLLDTLESYLISTTSQGRPTYRGLELAVEMLADDASDADVKIIALLAGRGPTRPEDTSLRCEEYDDDDDPSTEPLPAFELYGWPRSSTSDSPSVIYGSWVGVDACVAEAVDELVDNHDGDMSVVTSRSDIIFYSTALMSSDVNKGYMAHMSSNACRWVQCVTSGCESTSVRQVTDCTTGDFSFTASTAGQVEAMYQAIVNTISGGSLTLLSSTSSATAQVPSAQNVELPLPPGFECQSAQQALSLQNVFYGEGTMELGGFTLTYCPYE